MLQRCALGHAVKVSVGLLGASVGAECASTAPKSVLWAGFLMHFTAMAYICSSFSSTSEVKLQIQQQTNCVFLLEHS